MQRHRATLLLCATLCTALASDPFAEFERRVAPYRKLTETNSFAAACLDACPSLSSVVDGINAAESSMPESSAMSDMSRKQLTDVFEKMYADLYAIVCQHREAFACAAQRTGVCGAVSSDSEEMSPAALAAEADCMCDECPRLPIAFGGFMAYVLSVAVAAVATGSVPEMTEQEVFEMTCPLINPMKCALRSAVCSAQIELDGMEAFTELEQPCKDNGYALEPEQDVDGATCASVALALLASPVMAYAVIG